jgi:hypothetical protein
LKVIVEIPRRVEIETNLLCAELNCNEVRSVSRPERKNYIDVELAKVTLEELELVERPGME